MRGFASFFLTFALQAALSSGYPTCTAASSKESTSNPPVHVEAHQASAGCRYLPVDTADIFATNYVHLVKSVRLPAEITYRYIISRPATPEKPWILFIHGFPSTSFDWRHQIEYFTSRGYGVIAPDLLGYGGTDNPSDLNRFALKAIVQDLSQLLDCEGVDNVFAVGHDFGSIVLSRVISYMSDRLQGVVFVGVGYAAPPMAFNQAGVEFANNATLKTLGYPAFRYWYFMNSDDVAPIMDANMDSAFTLTYTDDPEYMKKHFSPVGKYRQWLLEGRTAPWTKYLEPDSKSIFKRITSFHGGYDGPVKSYKSLMRDVNSADEQALVPDAKIPVPALLLTAARDPVAIPEAQISNTQPFASNLSVKSIDAGHFLQVEQPQQVSSEIFDFIRNVLKN